jgi:hypothetical protein
VEAWANVADQPTDCIVLRYGLDELRMDKRVLASILWQSLPEAAREPDSEAAFEHRKFLAAISGLLMMFGPGMLRSIFGESPPQIPLGEDRVRWYLRLMVGMIPELAAQKPWNLDVDNAEQNQQQGITYTVRGFTAQPAQLAEGEAAPGGTGEGVESTDPTYELTSVTGG